MTDGAGLQLEVVALPRPRTTFVGRQRELNMLASLLDPNRHQTSRIVTLTGASGAGKTRLAVEAATRLVANGTFAEVGFVDVSALHQVTPGRIVELMGETIGSMNEDRVLIVADNCEELVGAAPEFSRLLEARPGLWTMITSQRLLGIYGEAQMLVAPLPTPPTTVERSSDLGAYETVRLFVERARTAAPEFELTDTNAPVLAAICRRLDGLPLAIELAAARVRLLPPDALLRKLEDRLGVLTGGPRDFPTRHRTLRAAIDWSYQLLDDDPRRLLRALSIFAASFNLPEAEAVVGLQAARMLDALQALLDTGLVRLELANGEPTYRVLGTVREYAAELLDASGEADVVRQKYADYYVRPPSISSPRRSRLAPRDDENLRHALESVLLDTLARSRLAGDRHQEAIALDGLGRLAVADSRLDLATTWFEQSARVFGELGNNAGVGIATLHLGRSIALTGQRPEAARTIQSAVDRLLAAGEHATAASGLIDLGLLVLETGDPPTALTHFKEALRLACEPLDASLTIRALQALATLAVQCRRPQSAATWLGAASIVREGTPRLRELDSSDGTSSADQSARAAIGENQFAAAFRKGQVTPLAQILDEALGLALTEVDVDPRAVAPTTGGVDELTRREREVAVLIASGYTNRSIAEALVISEWTVDSHVRHILSKLKLRSRAQVAAWAVERGLSVAS